WTPPSAPCSKPCPRSPTCWRSPRMASSLNRRGFLRGGIAGTAGTALTAGLLAGGAHADAAAGQAETPPSRYPFHGAHQPGLLPRPPSAKQAFSSFAAYDSMAGSRADLAALLRTLTARARFLSAGGVPPDLGVGSPPSDSDVLGPVIPADGLTITVSLG